MKHRILAAPRCAGRRPIVAVSERDVQDRGRSWQLSVHLITACANPCPLSLFLVSQGGIQAPVHPMVVTLAGSEGRPQTASRSLPWGSGFCQVQSLGGVARAGSARASRRQTVISMARSPARATRSPADGPARGQSAGYSRIREIFAKLPLPFRYSNHRSS